MCNVMREIIEHLRFSSVQGAVELERMFALTVDLEIGA